MEEYTLEEFHQTIPKPLDNILALTYKGFTLMAVVAGDDLNKKVRENPKDLNKIYNGKMIHINLDK